MTPPPVLSLVAAGLGALAVLLGPLTAHLGLLSPYSAFRAFALGTFTGSLFGIVLGLWSLLKTWNHPEATGRPLAWGGVLLGAALMLAMALAGASAAKVPPSTTSRRTSKTLPPSFTPAPPRPTRTGI